MLAAGRTSGSTTSPARRTTWRPSRSRAAPFDGRLDIYALGCMAYELLVGVPPFVAEDIQELLQQQLYTEPPPPLEARPDREIPTSSPP